VDGLVQQGDYAGARTASDKAKFWCWMSFGSILLILVFYILLAVVGAGISASQSR